MPVFGFSKEGFDPDLALIHRFLVGFCLVVPLDSFEIASIEGAVQLPTVVTWCTLHLEWTGITGSGIGAVLHLLGQVFSMKRTQRLTTRTHVEIVCCVIGEFG